MAKEAKARIKITHRFLDEAGDTTFYGKGRKPIIGQTGVSLTFGLGMLKINDELVATRQKIIELQHSIEKNKYLNVIPSVRKK